MEENILVLIDEKDISTQAEYVDTCVTRSVDLPVPVGDLHLNNVIDQRLGVFFILSNIHTETPSDL